MRYALAALVFAFQLRAGIVAESRVVSAFGFMAAGWTVGVVTAATRLDRRRL